ncbi:MAG: hypothetical protein KGL39_52680, partial [Patescibacteria group bacterium]|nr:hypothetical protein [Patescibacteria group bacterium]
AVAASLASQRDSLKADLQSKHDALTTQINAAITAAGSDTTTVNTLKAYQSQADSALASGLAGVDTDYANALATAQSQLNLQQQVVTQHITDLVAVQGITAVQDQLSNLLLQPTTTSQTTTASVPYPTPTFTAPAPPYAISGFNPAWSTTGGYYIATMYDYATGAQATAVATSATSGWINSATNNLVAGPPVASSTTTTGSQTTTGGQTTASVPYPTPTFTAPAPPYTISGFNPAWSTTGGYYIATMYDYATGAQATAVATSATSGWVNTSTNNLVAGPPAGLSTTTTSQPVTTAAPPSATGATSPQYYTDSSGTIWVTDPTTGQWTVYSSGSAAASAPSASDQSGVPADYYMFSTNQSSAATPATMTGPDGVVWTQASDGNWYTTDSSGVTWTLDANGNVVQAQTGAASPAPAVGASSGSLLGWGWGFSSLAVPQGGPVDVNRVKPYNYRFDASPKASTVEQINRMPVLPASAITGFSQWSGLASSLISAVGSVGSAAITAALAPHPGGSSSSGTAATAPVVVPAAATATPTNYTPWLIGGALGLGGLVLALSLGRKRR